jgi:chromosome segregation ATPase
VVLNIEARVTRLEEDFEAIGSTVLETRVAVDRLEKAVSSQTKRLTSLENTVAGHTTRLTSVENKLDSLENKVDSLENKVDSHTDLLNEILRRLPAAA